MSALNGAASTGVAPKADAGATSAAGASPETTERSAPSGSDTSAAAAPGIAFGAGLFDLEKLRLSQSDVSVTRKLLLTVPVRKPNRQEFVRVHPDEAWRLPTWTLTAGDDRKTFLVAPDLWSQLPGELSSTLLVTAVTRQGVVFLWPLRLPSSDGRVIEWHASALEAATIAQTSWVKVVANMGLGAYEVHEAQAELPEPNWPDVDFQKLVELAFKDAYIRDEQHPVLRRLRGAI